MDSPSQGEEMTAENRIRNRRIELRMTPEDSALIDSAIAVVGTDLTSFMITSATTAARQVLADRDEFVLNPQMRQAWEARNDRPAQDLPGLRSLMARPSPFC